MLWGGGGDGCGSFQAGLTHAFDETATSEVREVRGLGWRQAGRSPQLRRGARGERPDLRQASGRDG